MVETVEGGRLYYPPEDENKPDERKVMHPETDSGQVIMQSGRTLEEEIARGRFIVSRENPNEPCLWASIIGQYTV